MFAIAFDLSSDEAQRHHPKGRRQAYRDIGRALKDHGFNRVQGSVYLADEENLVRLTEAMNSLRSLDWFAKSVANVRAFRVEQGSDFTDFIKHTSSQIEED